MNWNEIEGKWEQMTGKINEKWGKFTNDDITMIKGKKDQLLGKLRERYGYTHEQATKEADLFVQNCSCAKK